MSDARLCYKVPFAPLLGVQRCIRHCLSLPWLRSDILTPLAALGVPFDIDDTKGPLIEDTVRTMEEVRRKAASSSLSMEHFHETWAFLQVRKLHTLELDQLQFVGEALTILRQEVHGQVAIKLLPGVCCLAAGWAG